MPYPCSKLLWSQSQECGLSSIAWKWPTSPCFSKMTVLFPPLPTLSFPAVEIGFAGDPPAPGTVQMVCLGFGTSRDQIPPSVLPTAAPFNRRKDASVAATRGWDETHTQIYLGVDGGEGGGKKNLPRHFTSRVVGYSPDLWTQLCFASVLAVSLLSFQQISYYTALDCYIFNQK